MTPIPPKLRALLEKMPRMRKCTVSLDPSVPSACEGQIQWHHVWIYGGRQIQEHWAILAACDKHHEMVKKEKIVKEAFERYSLEIASDEDLAQYPKKAWYQIKKYLKVNENNIR